MAFLIGPILTAINQTWILSLLLAGRPIPLIALGRVALTFVVPFVVSLYSSTMAERARTTSSQDPLAKRDDEGK